MNKYFKTYYIGLIYPKATIFGLLICFIAFIPVNNILSIKTISSNEVYELIITIILLPIGLIPFTSFKILKISKSNETICYNDVILFIFKNTKSYHFKDFDKITLKSESMNYNAGGGFLTTAKNYYSIKETSINFVNSTNKKNLKIENIGSKLRAEKIYNELIQITNYKSSIKLSEQ